MDTLEIGIVETSLLALGLSLDCFAASVGRGVGAVARRPAAALWIALTFGAFHFVMPTLGWFIGIAVMRSVAAIDHWVALALLSGVGALMIRSGLVAGGDGTRGLRLVTGFVPLFALGAATSVDAAAVGVGLSVATRSILVTASAIAGVTFVMSLIGLRLGRAAGVALGPRAEIAGGCLLIGLGIKIVVDHTFA